MEEIVEEELEAEAVRIERNHIEKGRQYGDSFQSLVLGKLVTFTPEYVKLLAYNLWGSFLYTLPDSHERILFIPDKGRGTSDERKPSKEEWRNDIALAINRAGIDEMELKRALDLVSHHDPEAIHFGRGYVAGRLPLETIERLIKPVYIELRKIGYTPNDLNT